MNWHAAVGLIAVSVVAVCVVLLLGIVTGRFGE